MPEYESDESFGGKKKIDDVFYKLDALDKTIIGHIQKNKTHR